MTVPHQILLIDDDRCFRESAASVLTGVGHQTFEAGDAATGLELIRQHHPDLVILEMLLPGVSGFRLVEQIRGQLLLPVPIMMITANLGEHHQEYARILGVNAYLTKPVRIARFLATVTRALRQSSVEGGSPGQNSNPLAGVP